MKKKTLLLNLFMALSVFAFVACNDDDADSLQPKMTIEGADEFGAQKLEFSNKTSDQQIKITANDDWFIRIPEEAESWLTVTPSEGKGSIEPIAINVNVAANDKTETRKATLAFVCNKIEQKALLTIEQEKLYTLTAIPSKKLINKAGGEISFAIDTNTDSYNYEIDEEGQTWLTVKSKADKKLTLTAAPMEDEERKAVITFTTDIDPSLVEVIEISQKDMYLDPQYDHVNVDLAGGDCSIDINANVEWECSIDAEGAKWLTQKGGGEDNKLVLTALSNSAGRREAVVTLTSPVDEALKTTVTVIQTPKLIMDIVFNADGSATDLSNNHLDVIYTANSKVSVAWNEAYAKYVPSFTYTFAGSGSGAGYRIEYSKEIGAQLEDGHSIEAVVMTTNTTKTGESKAVSSTQSGGTAMLIHSATRNNTLGYAAFVGGAWKFVVTNIVPKAGEYYHIICVWDKDNGVGKVYINGELAAASDTFVGEYKHQQKNPMAFGVGYNSTGAPGSYNGGWTGDVALARVYDAVLTDADAKALYKAAMAK